MGIESSVNATIMVLTFIFFFFTETHRYTKTASAAHKNPPLEALMAMNDKRTNTIPQAKTIRFMKRWVASNAKGRQKQHTRT